MAEENYLTEIASKHTSGRMVLKFQFGAVGCPVWNNIVMAAFLLVFSSANAEAQVIKTQLDGLEVSADAAQKGCEIQLNFGGSRITTDATITPVRAVRAVDDTGQNLIWANRPFTESRTGTYQWVNLQKGTHQWVQLMPPSANARSIELECAAELLTPTISQPVFTNVAAHLGQSLQDPLLKQHHIEITVYDSKQRPGVDATIEWEDPENKVLDVCFQTSKGREMRGQEGKFGAMKMVSFQKLSEPLGDLKLAVRLDVPQKREAFGFKIEKIPLIWIQPTNLEVTASCKDGFEAFETEPKLFHGLVDLEFRGGPMTNAAGVLDISITRGEGDAGQKIERQWQGTGNWLDRRCPLDAGGYAGQLVYMHAKPTQPRSIKVLEGNVKLFYPDRSSEAFVKVSCGLSGGSKVIPVSEKHGVMLRFLGVKNFATIAREITRTNNAPILSVRVVNGISSLEPVDVTKMPEHVQDAFLFTLEDPRGLRLGGYPGITFYDSRGRRMEWVNVCSGSDFWLMQFGTLPEKAEFTFYLTPPESVQVVHFKVENIALR